MRHHFLAATAAATLMISAAAAQAEVVVDQEHFPVGQARITTQYSPYTFQQGVTVGLAGLLSGIDLWAAEAPGTFEVFINRGAGYQTDAAEFTTTVTPLADSVFHIDLAAAGLTFAAGDQFQIGFQATSIGSCCGLRATSTVDQYAGGGLYVNNVQYGNFDIAFRTYVDVAPPVPEPENIAMMLAGLGLVGFVAKRRKA